MHVQFITSVAVITADPVQSRRFYVDTLGLPLQIADGDDYFHSESIGESKHFGVWPLTQAAQACFGTDTWPADRPIPQASIEFEVEAPRRYKPRSRSSATPATRSGTMPTRSRGAKPARAFRRSKASL
jgi:catechol 2,3-dioxygenase-like lactoylglutathione lyase family enzyme